MKIENLVYDVLNSIPLGIWILGGIVISLRIVSKVWGGIIRGWISEKMTSQIGLKRLPSSEYSSYGDLYFPRPDGQGTTQVDHVVVSRYGVFVIETKNFKGWIFGGKNQKQWTVSLRRKKFRFHNPLHQNELHLRALSKYLDIDRSKFISIVFFVGESALKTDFPPNVLDSGLLDYIKSFREERVDVNTVKYINKTLTVLDTSLNRKNLRKTHIASLTKIRSIVRRKEKDEQRQN